MVDVTIANPCGLSQSWTKWWHKPPTRYIFTLYHLFFARKFLIHRLMGLAYLLQYATAIFLYFFDYQKFKNSPLVITLPVWGVLQSISAALTFTFLPKKNLKSGFFSSKSTLSYNFVVENSFFVMQLCFYWLYCHDFLYKVFKRTVILENIFVFLSLVFLRQLWPKTTFRDAINSQNEKSEKNFMFFYYGTWLTKLYYIWGKHMLGYCLSYIRFLDRLSEKQMYHIHLGLILGCFTLTVSMFLHTLKFKGYIGPKTAFVPYVISYLATFYIVFRISEAFLVNWGIILLAAFGIPLNFCSKKLQIYYQVLMMVGFNAKRYGLF